MSSIVFTVQGDPATAGSKKGFPIKRKNGKMGVAMVDASGAKGKNWRLAVREAYSNVVATSDDPERMIMGPIHLSIVFRFSRPKCHYGTGKNAGEQKASAPDFHTKKPDLTKLTRAVEDALNGIAWKDDSQIMRQSTAKGFCHCHVPSHAIVTIESV